jgi:hypothetical protein
LPVANQKPMVFSINTIAAILSAVTGFSIYAASKVAAAKMFEFCRWKSRSGMLLCCIRAWILIWVIRVGLTGWMMVSGLVLSAVGCVLMKYVQLNFLAFRGLACDSRSRVLERQVYVGELRCG